jgi:hypothetical protein
MPGQGQARMRFRAAPGGTPAGAPGGDLDARTPSRVHRALATAGGLLALLAAFAGEPGGRAAAEPDPARSVATAGSAASEPAGPGSVARPDSAVSDSAAASRKRLDGRRGCAL